MCMCVCGERWGGERVKGVDVTGGRGRGRGRGRGWGGGGVRGEGVRGGVIPLRPVPYPTSVSED